MAARTIRLRVPPFPVPPHSDREVCSFVPIEMSEPFNFQKSIVVNVGAGILTNPANTLGQNDVLLYGLSFARAVTQQTELVGELNGRFSTRSAGAPTGTESRGILKLGALGYPGDDALARAAAIVGTELGWSDARRREEIASVRSFYGVEAAVHAKN